MVPEISKLTFVTKIYLLVTCGYLQLAKCLHCAQNEFSYIANLCRIAEIAWCLIIKLIFLMSKLLCPCKDFVNPES